MTLTQPSAFTSGAMQTTLAGAANAPTRFPRRRKRPRNRPAGRAAPRRCLPDPPGATSASLTCAHTPRTPRRSSPVPGLGTGVALETARPGGRARGRPGGQTWEQTRGQAQGQAWMAPLRARLRRAGPEQPPAGAPSQPPSPSRTMSRPQPLRLPLGARVCVGGRRSCLSADRAASLHSLRTAVCSGDASRGAVARTPLLPAPEATARLTGRSHGEATTAHAFAGRPIGPPRGQRHTRRAP